MKRMKSMTLLLISLLMLAPLFLFSQPEKGKIRSGNKNYQKGNFSEAEINYRKALEKNNASFNANYNLGNALYRQEKFEEASRQFNAAANLAPDKSLAAHDYHNLGNSYFKQQKFKESIEAYKSALRINPSDEETRYNLAYAQKMLKEQEQNQKNKGKDEQNKDQQNQDKGNNEQNQEKQNEQQQADKQQGQPKQPEQKISKEDAERLLQALRNNEKEIQKRLNKIEGQRIKTEKQW